MIFVISFLSAQSIGFGDAHFFYDFRYCYGHSTSIRNFLLHDAIHGFCVITIDCKGDVSWEKCAKAKHCNVALCSSGRNLFIDTEIEVEYEIKGKLYD